MAIISKADLPFCLTFETQPTVEYCTLSCIRMLLRANGVSVPYSKLKVVLKTVKGFGTPMLYTQAGRRGISAKKEMMISDRLLSSDLGLSKRGLNVRTETLPQIWEKLLLDYLENDIYPIMHLEIMSTSNDVNVKFGCFEITGDTTVGHDVIAVGMSSNKKIIYFLDPICQVKDGMNQKICYGKKKLPPTYMSYSSFERYMNANGRQMTLIFKMKNAISSKTLDMFDSMPSYSEDD